MGDYNKMASEDDEDLEALRLAALQSLKKKNLNVIETNVCENVKNEQTQPTNCFNNDRNKGRRTGKFFRNNQNRFARNGQQNGWNRNSNLIAVPVMSNEPNIEEQPPPKNKIKENDVPKLILPQDRYCKTKEKEEEVTNSPVSKFDRYDNSDDSESDSDDDDDEEGEKIKKSSNTSTPPVVVESSTLKRSNSLDALMEELENEIKGGPTTKSQTTTINQIDDSKQLKEEKVKNKKKKKIVVPLPAENDNEVNSTKENIPEPTIRPAIVQKKPNGINRNKKWTHSKHRRQQNTNFPQQQPPQNVDYNSGTNIPPIQPCNMVPPYLPNIPQYPVYNHPIEPLYQSPLPTLQPPHPPTGMMYETSSPQQQPPPSFLENPQHRVPIYDRPLSPLLVNTDSYTTTLAPLSPRSAAFVMENRAIIEKRKRRSYSRSPSPPPRYRRSSISPPPRRASKSPPPLPPIKRNAAVRSPSPVRKVLPPKNIINNTMKRPTIHDRLGTKTTNDNNKTDDKKENINKIIQKDNNKEDNKKVEDPILEARRRKFETNEITMKEGVIRLKPTTTTTSPIKENKETTTITENNKTEMKNDNNKEDIDNDDNNGDNDDEDLLLEDIDDELEINQKLDELFSDEESNSDNEGRFKIKNQTNESNEKIIALPFTKLINGAKNNIKSIKNDENRLKSSSQKRRYRSRSPSSNNKEQQQNKKLKSSSSTSTTRQRRSEKPLPKTFSIDNKKIEIKIRNPSKYEESDEHKSSNSSKDDKRKVEIMEQNNVESGNNHQIDENADGFEHKSNEGDLRTQLSRKRAERQKIPLPDVVPSRLLQNALQGVGFKKGKNSRKDVDEAIDGKLPIRLRLGTTSNTTTEMFGKKTRKRGSLEQV